MKKYLLVTAALTLSSPLLYAQATPAVPATPATPSSENEVNQPTTDENGQTSTSARSGKNSAGATGNPNNQSGKARTRSGGGNEFGTYDSDGNGQLSKDELAGNLSLSGRFSELDKNTDGAVSRMEFATGLKANPSGGTSGASSSSKSKTDPGRESQSDKDEKASGKDKVTEGSDRTEKDDDLNRRLNPSD
jgi:hypothetical protein